MAHATLSPSSAHEWLNCALSVKMRELYAHLDRNRYSEANAQGTIKHHVIEQCLINDFDPYSFVGMEINLGDLREDDEDMPDEWAEYNYEFTEDDADSMMSALDEIDSYHLKNMVVERRVDLSKYCGENQFGTLDLGGLIDCGDGWYDMLVWDNKFGRVPVDPVKNLQMMLYALGLYDNIYSKMDIRIRSVIIRVWQPLVRGGGGKWETTIPKLLRFGRKVVGLAERALSKNPEANPGPVQCEYCIGAKLMKCRDYVEWNKEIIGAMLADGEDIDTLVETDEIPCLKFNGVEVKLRTWILDNFAMLSKFVGRLEEQAFEDAYYRGDVPGKKLVIGSSSRRKFKNPERAAEVIAANIGKDKAYTRKPISPAQLEKIVGRKNMGEYDDMIDKGVKKMVLVNAHDSRDSVMSIREMLNEGDE